MHRLIASTVALIALVGGAAHAEDATMRVRIGDLNLHHEDGAKVALQRIKTAATKFCGNDITSPIDFAASVTSCRKGMTEKAVVQLNAPLVTALYAPRLSTTQYARR